MKSKFNLYSRLTGEPRVITLRCWAITDKNGNIRSFTAQAPTFADGISDDDVPF